MLSIRIVAAGALISVMTVGGAMAQTATDTGAGKPIQLLQVTTQPDKTKSKPHAKRIMKIRTAAKRTGRRHHLAAERPIHVAEAAKPAAPAAAPADVWANVTPVTAPATVASAAPAPQLAAAAPESTPSELVVGGQTVHVVSPDDANEIDRAADAQIAPSVTATPSAVATAAPAADTATVARAHEQTSHVGSASWIAQILAALGGAVAAGSAAWFLMGSAPQRTYG
ncbi:MAG: hypothetical protein ABSF87_01525 [Xanthobacteraceae bacterium]|jgi:hypothetical protein